MSLPTRSLDDVTRRVLGYFRTSFEGLPLGVKKFLGRQGRANALTYWTIQKGIEDLDKDIVPSPQTSDDVLSEYAILLGLPDGKGGLGRRLAVEASGGLATLTGVLGTIYTDAITATAEDGTQIMLSGLVTIPGTAPGYGSIGAKFVAITPGLAGNLPAGTTCVWDSAPSGADPSFVLTSPLSGGLNLETNPQVYGRIVARLQTPPRGGVAEDFRIWEGEVDGVVGVFVYPKRSGTGTVDVVIVGGGSGQGRVPSSTVLIAAKKAVAAKAVVGIEEANIFLPLCPDAAGLDVVIRVAPVSSKYAFDWDDSAGPLVVSSYTPGSPATIELSAIAPDSLLTAIDAHVAVPTVPAPRLQVLSSTGEAINAPIAVVSYSNIGSQTVLTLDAASSDFAPPSSGDLVYAYGPVVATIAAGALAVCDSLGPSRASGYADANPPWSDKLTISALVRVAEDAIDTDGTQLISEVEPGGITIDGTAADVAPVDDTTPELLWIKSIAVIAS